MSILTSLRYRLFLLFYELRNMILRIRGLQVGRGCIISGSPDIRRCRGSRISIGDHAVLHSKIKYNTLIRYPMALSTVEPEAEIHIGDHCGLSGCKLVCADHISIGEYTIIGPDTIIYDCKEHEYNPQIGWLGRRQRTGKAIRIGSRCYIGMRCIILKGVTIGDNCVISAGTTITRDVPAGHLAQGNPAIYTPLPEHLGGAGSNAPV